MDTSVIRVNGIRMVPVATMTKHNCDSCSAFIGGTCRAHSLCDTIASANGWFGAVFMPCAESGRRYSETLEVLMTTLDNLDVSLLTEAECSDLAGALAGALMECHKAEKNRNHLSGNE